jgi:hypothetical protein
MEWRQLGALYRLSSSIAGTSFSRLYSIKLFFLFAFQLSLTGLSIFAALAFFTMLCIFPFSHSSVYMYSSSYCLTLFFIFV